MSVIGIIGIGFVGGAILQSFKEKGITTAVYDKFKKIGSIDTILKTDMVFLCLPTPYDKTLKCYNIEPLHETCKFLQENTYNGLVIIKSTVEPLISQALADKYGLSIIHNPEFLTASTAYFDFHNQKHCVIGKTSNIGNEQVKTIIDFYKYHYPSVEVSICSSDESESMKLFCNCFYSVKIQFFNELFLLCKRQNIDFDNVKNLMLKNGWINPMHTQVPGTDGKLSYGGFCFPKDTSALLSLMKSYQTPHEVISACVVERNSMRSD